MIICRPFTRLLTSLVLPTIVAALVGGCSTPGEKMVDTFAATRETVAKAQMQVDKTLVSLHALRSTPTPALKEGFRTYKGDVEKLEAHGVDARRRATVLSDRAESHIQAWSKEMERLKDPTVKSTMADRQRALRGNYKLLVMYAQDARKDYVPYLAGNKDIVQALTIDLSPSAISTLSSSIDRVLLDGQQLQQRLNSMQIALRNMADGISPLGEMDSFHGGASDSETSTP